jgi:choline dehydrogenase-like flavoprotein
MKDGKIAMGEFINQSASNIGIALVKPLSRGSIKINTADPFDDPVVDFATLRNPLDLDIVIEMIRATRKILDTPAMQSLGPTITTPAANLTSNADLGAFIRENLASSLWHPTGTAAMLKKELGGVVGPDLLVYGTKNLSVVDASIIPICPSTHITSTVYAVAEKVSNDERRIVTKLTVSLSSLQAADIIKSRTF